MKKDNKTISATVYFFANDLPPRVGSKNRRIPCWATGFVYVNANKEKGIEPKKVAFNGLSQIPTALCKAMSQANIVTITRNV